MKHPTLSPKKQSNWIHNNLTDDLKRKIANINTTAPAQETDIQIKLANASKQARIQQAKEKCRLRRERREFNKRGAEA